MRIGLWYSETIRIDLPFSDDSESTMKSVFLRAEWRKLAMFNYVVDPEILKPHLPAGTELDFFEGKCFVSLVGFMFLRTRLKGIPVPFHQNFEEFNLRFYVRHFDNGTWKRGAVFIKEIVPKPMITLVARTVYKEPYETRKMAHLWEEHPDHLSISYSWKTREWNSASVKTGKILTEIETGSEAEFITEHYWGYTRISDKITSEYGVEHPRWKMYETLQYNVQVRFLENYGRDFAGLQNENPSSVFVVEGSDILVRDGRMLRF